MEEVRDKTSLWISLAKDEVEGLSSSSSSVSPRRTSSSSSLLKEVKSDATSSPRGKTAPLSTQKSQPKSSAEGGKASRSSQLAAPTIVFLLVIVLALLWRLSSRVAYLEEKLSELESRSQ